MKTLTLIITTIFCFSYFSNTTFSEQVEYVDTVTASCHEEAALLLQAIHKAKSKGRSINYVLSKVVGEDESMEKWKDLTLSVYSNEQDKKRNSLLFKAIVDECVKEDSKIKHDVEV